MPSKLINSKGKVEDPLRGLYMICEAKGILHSYHQAVSQFRQFFAPTLSLVRRVLSVLQ